MGWPESLGTASDASTAFLLQSSGHPHRRVWCYMSTQRRIMDDNPQTWPSVVRMCKRLATSSDGTLELGQVFNLLFAVRECEVSKKRGIHGGHLCPAPRLGSSGDDGSFKPGTYQTQEHWWHWGFGSMATYGNSGIPPMSWHRADLTTPTWNRKSRDFRSESAGNFSRLGALLRINVIHDLVGLRLEALMHGRWWQWPKDPKVHNQKPAFSLGLLMSFAACF